MTSAAQKNVETTRPTSQLRLADGARAELIGDALELRDASGRLLVRYENGAAEISAPAGDLVLRSATGRVVIAGVDVEIAAVRDAVCRGGRRAGLAAGDDDSEPQVSVERGAAKIQADRIEARARETRLATGRATVFARAIATTAVEVATHAERIDVTAARLVERTRDTFRDVADLAQTRVGRVRTLVRDVFAVYSRRAVMVSKDDTSIDGEKILLG